MEEEEKIPWYKRNPEKAKALRQKYRSSKKGRAAEKAYLKLHPEKNWYKRHPERASTSRKRYRELHLEDVQSYNDKYRRAHLESYRKANKEWRDRHPGPSWSKKNREKSVAYTKEYRHLHPEVHREAFKKWRDKDPMRAQQISENIKKKKVRWAEADPNVFLPGCETLYFYKLSVPDFQKILVSQQNCCAICRINFIKIKMKICIDHCHKTGKVRGLLCPSCNRGLGQFKDEIDYLNRAIQYLQREEMIYEPIR